MRCWLSEGVFLGFFWGAEVFEELGVGHTIDVGDVPIVVEDASDKADDWFVACWHSGGVWVVGAL